MNGILWALGGTLFTFSISTLGAMNVFFIKKDIDKTLSSIFLGFAAGVMIAASIWSLLIPAIDRAESLDQTAPLIVSIGFLLGVGLLLWADGRFRSFYHKRLIAGEIKTIKESTLMLIAAITIHNIPEGMAVGLSFALAMSQPENHALFSGAVAMAVGIGIQNYPEGTAVSLPLLGDGLPRKKAFLIGSASAIVEPISGVCAATLTTFITPLMPLLLSFAAGTMIYVVVQELLPEAQKTGEGKNSTLGFIAGFLVMMILDVSLS